MSDGHRGLIRAKAPGSDPRERKFMKLVPAAGLAALLAIGVAAPAMADTTTSTFEPPATTSVRRTASAAGLANGTTTTASSRMSTRRPASASSRSTFPRRRCPGPSRTGRTRRRRPTRPARPTITTDSRPSSPSMPPGRGRRIQISVAPDRGDGGAHVYVRLEDHADGVHVIFRTRRSRTRSSARWTVRSRIPWSSTCSSSPAGATTSWTLHRRQAGHTGTSWEDYYRR